jgi:hypothetical protein
MSDPTPAADPRLAELTEAARAWRSEASTVLTPTESRLVNAVDRLTLLPARTATTEAVALVAALPERLAEAMHVHFGCVSSSPTEDVARVCWRKDADAIAAALAATGGEERPVPPADFGSQVVYNEAGISLLSQERQDAIRRDMGGDE